MLVDAPPRTRRPELPAALAELLERSPADVAVLSGGRPDPARGVHVPFGGGEHDWAALELGAWLASATGAPLRLVGTRADPRSGRRDASRLLADASLAVQRVVDVDAAPAARRPGRARRRGRGRRSRRGRHLAALATRGHRRRATRAGRATRARRCCSSTAARARACSPRARAARASPGRSALSAAARTRSSEQLVAAVVTAQPIRGERYCPNEKVP